MSAPAPAAAGKTHPPGLRTLFFTEMWERFSYYGMRAMLVLFMVDAVRGGMGLTDQTATAIYGLYTAAVYLSALPGGWLADRILGARRAIWHGGIIIALGHFTLAIQNTKTFFLGLLLIVIGTGLLKPNISALVGELYPEGGARRDAGFTVFYMGINIGATLGPLICGSLGKKFNWHYGFAAAGAGMILGLIQFKLTGDRLGDAGLRPSRETPVSGRERMGLLAAAVVLLAIVGAMFAEVIRINPVALAKGASYCIAGIAVLYFLGVFLLAKLDGAEKRRVGVIVILFLAATLFWAGFEQVGSSFNLFADRYTDRMVETINRTIPTEWFQSLGPIFIVSFAPVAASLWVALNRRNMNPSLAAKFGLGLVLLSAGLLVMAGASYFVAKGERVMPAWLITTYLVHTFAELCLSPVGLSTVTKLSPKRLVGQMMGTWFLAASLGNLLAGLLAGRFDSDAVEKMSGQYVEMAALPLLAGVALILLAKRIKSWAGGVE